MPDPDHDSLLDGDRLAGLLEDADLRIVDASWYAAGDGIDPRAVFAAEHIPGAVFFDIDAVASRIGELPHMMPAPETFAAAAAALGLCPEHRLVFYDQRGVAAAACRAWWTFRAFGYRRAQILDGGLPAWRARGGTLTDAKPAIRPCRPRLRTDLSLLRSLEQVRANIATQGEQLVDARSPERFRGEAEEPWGRPGRIPGSLNLFYADLLDAASARFVAADKIRARFRAAGVDLSRPIVTSCGSGVTACVLNFALHLLGIEDAALFDGSWAEWVRRPGTPKLPPRPDDAAGAPRPDPD